MSTIKQSTQFSYPKQSLGQKVANQRDGNESCDIDIDIDHLIQQELQPDMNLQNGSVHLNEQYLLNWIQQIDQKYTIDGKKALQSFPPVQGLFQCLKTVYSQFPEQMADNAIMLLHSVLHGKECPSKSGISGNKLVEPPPIKEVKNQKGRKAKVSKDEQRQMIRFKNPPRKDDEALIANSYVHYGYGLRVLREKLGDASTTANRYNNLITIIIRNTFRSIESVLNQTTKQMRQIGYNQQKILRSPLINCSKWLPPNQYATFIEFVKGTYGIDEAVVDLQTVSNLYDSIMIQLKQRQMQEIMTKQPKTTTPIKFKNPKYSKKNKK